MATQYTSILKLALPTQGELSGTWGTAVNEQVTSMVEEAIAGLKTIDTWSTNSATLSTANGATSESRAAILNLTDTTSDLSGAATLICPAASKVYIVKNATGQAVTVKTASGTGIAVPNGTTAFLFCDGTNVVEAINNVTGNLTVGGNASIGGNLTVTGNATISGSTLTADTAFVPDTADGATLGTAALEFSDLFLADGGIINFGNDQDITLTHAADTSLSLGGAGSTTGLIINNTATDGDPFLSFALSGTQTFTMGIDDGDSDKFKIGTTAIGTNTRLSIDSSGNIDVAGDLTAGGSFIIGSASIAEAELEMIDGITAGTVAASKAMVVDANKDIGTIRNLTIDGTFSDGNYTFDTSGNVSGLGTVSSGAITSSGNITSGGSFIIGSASIAEAELEMIDGITAGTVAASKAMVVDSNKDIGTIRNLTIDGTFSDGNYTFDTSGNVSGLGTVSSGAITSSGNITSGGSFIIGSASIAEAELEMIDGITAGTVAASKAMVVDSNKDIGTIRNLTIDGTFSDGNYTFDTSGNVSGLGTVASGAITSSGVVIGTTFEPSGDTSSGDNAAIGYTSTEGLILTGQGSTNDVTIKNDADADVIEIPTGTTNVTMAGNLTVAGDFTVSGTTTTIDSTTVAVADAMLKLAKDQGTSADAVDFGFYGKYGVGGTAKFAGIFRDQSASGDPFTFFDSLQAEPGTTVNTSGTGYDLADIAAGGATFADNVTVTGNVTSGGSFIIGSASIAEAELEMIDGITAGTVAASKAVVVDSNKDIGTIRNLTIDGTFSDGNYTFDTSGNVSGLGTVASGAITSSGNITSGGSFIIGSASIAEAELEMLDGITAGTVAASKAVVVDSNKDIGTIRNLTIDGTFSDGNYTFDTSGNVSGLGTVASGAITSSGNITSGGSFIIGSASIAEAELEMLDGITAGTVAASKAVVVDSNKDIGTIRNLTIDGTFSDGNYTFDTSGNVSGLGTVASGAITSSGKSTFNAGISVKNGATGPGFIEFFEDSDHGTNHVKIQANSSDQSYSGDITLTLPSTTGTLLNTVTGATKGFATAMAIAL
jgi:hypothetical protein